MTSYIGRFAPSPSGPLHFGSLVAALGSYLDARAHGGKWLLRIEDIDPPREVVGARDIICRQLEALGLHWDGEITRQSDRDEYYQAALATLKAKKLLYACDCTRKQIKARGRHYDGHCRERALPFRDGFALRFLNRSPSRQMFDRLFGHRQWPQSALESDCILRRRDGLWAYQLAVVVDDIQQGITHVVRGADLLSSTPVQIDLHQALDHQPPCWLHLPLAVSKPGRKLSKQNHAPAIDTAHPQKTLVRALKFLGQPTNEAMLTASVNELLAYAVSQWRPEKIPKTQEICEPEQQ